MRFRFTLSYDPLDAEISPIPDLEDWLSTGGADYSWTTGEQPFVLLPGAGLFSPASSELLYANTNFEVGREYTISVNYTKVVNSGVSNPRSIELRIVDFLLAIQFSNSASTPSSPGGSGTVSITFTATADCNRLAVVATEGSNVTITVNSYTWSVNVPIQTQEISEPDGWKGAKIKLERDKEFYSLIEHYEGAAGGAFIFYGDNGVVDGGINFIKDIEQNVGFDSNIDFLSEFAPDDVNYIEIFRGLLDISSKNEMKDNKMQVPVIRDDFWTRFINRMSTPVNLSDNVDLDGNPVLPCTPITVNLTGQTIPKQYYSELVEPVEFSTIPDGYIQLTPENVVLDEIEEVFDLFTAANEAVPVFFFSPKEKGSYTFTFRIVMSGSIAVNPALGDPDESFTYASGWVFTFQRNAEDAIEFTKTDVDFSSPAFAGNGWSVFEYTTTLQLEIGEEIRAYGQEISNLITAVTFWTASGALYRVFGGGGATALYANNPTGYDVPTFFRIEGQTTYQDTTAQGYLIHDLIHGILARLGLGTDPFRSDFLGSTLTNAAQYDEDGSGWPYVILKGLQIRQYSLTEKPFFASFKQIWDGINPILNLGLGYEMLDGSPETQIVRIEEKIHFCEDDISVNFSNVRDISSSYDQELIFKTIKVGYKKWQAEEISGNDDPQTKKTYATRFEKTGKDLTLESDFIAASIAIETTRRKTKEKSADYKFDNENFIIALNRDDISPDLYIPEFDENFESISNLENTSGRYNLILTPLRSLLRWITYLNGCLQQYPNSFYKFVSGEGNYDMISDYDCVGSDFGQAKSCDSRSESQDIAVNDDDFIDGYLNLPMVYDIRIPMEWEEYETIRNNRKKAIGISQTTSGHQPFKIKSLEYDIVKGQATVKAWPKTFFDIQVVEQEFTAPDCADPVEPPEPLCTDVFDPDYCAILAKGEDLGYILPSEGQQILQNQLVLDLKSAGIWEDLDIFYVFATDGDSDFATINWKNPNVYQCVKFLNLTFVTNIGFQPSNNGYLSTQWAPNPDGVNYTLNEGGAFSYVNTNYAASNTDAFGCIGNPGNAFHGYITIQPKNAASLHVYALNSGSTSVGSSVSSEGFFHIKRTASNLQALYKNGAQVDSNDTSATNTLSTRAVQVLGFNNNGSAMGNNQNMQVSTFGIGASLTGKESALYNIWDDYFSSL
jgi:hypothetical protein